jgi:hypothetical protein
VRRSASAAPLDAWRGDRRGFHRDLEFAACRSAAHLDDSEVTLKPGDVVVQRGTDHAWENRADMIARAAFFHIDARFSDELLAKLPKPLALMR